MRIIILFLFAPVLSIAQNYNPFPTDSAYWSVEHGNFGPWGYQCQYTVHYGMIGDTIIAGNSWSKIYENNPLSSSYDTSFNLTTAVYYAALREDSSKKIFVRRSADTSDILLYDFSLNVGDTFCFDFFNGMCETVQSIDSLMYNGTYHRIYHFISQTWIEGIGSTAI